MLGPHESATYTDTAESCPVRGCVVRWPVQLFARERKVLPSRKGVVDSTLYAVVSDRAGILFTGRVCTLHQKVVGPIAVTFGLFGLSSTIFILTQGFVTPCLVAATLAALRGGALAVSWNGTEPC